MRGSPKGGLCRGRAKPSTKAAVCRTAFSIAQVQRQRAAPGTEQSPIEWGSQHSATKNSTRGISSKNSRLYSVVTTKKEPVNTMIGQKYSTHLTNHQPYRSSPLTPARGRGFEYWLRLEWSWRIELAAGQVLRATPCWPSSVLFWRFDYPEQLVQSLREFGGGGMVDRA
jgi:hypothetical protein